MDQPALIVLRHRIAERDEVVTVTFSTLARYLVARHSAPDDGRRLGIAVGAFVCASCRSRRTRRP